MLPVTAIRREGGQKQNKSNFSKNSNIFFRIAKNVIKKLSQPNNNHNPNNKTIITVVGLRLLKLEISLSFDKKYFGIIQGF